MTSLEAKSFLLLFDQANIEVQRETLLSLLKTKRGKESIRQIKLDNMLIWFKNPMVKDMVERCVEAQNHFLEYLYNSSWENINQSLPSWISNNNEITSVFVSDNYDTVYICPKTTDLSDMVINSVTLRYVGAFDPNLITNKAFNLNNLYLGYRNDYRVWWKHCDNLA